MSASNRFASIPEQSSDSRRLWFLTPTRLSLLAAVVIGAVVLAGILLPRSQVGVPAGRSPGAPTLSAVANKSASPSATPSVTPTPATPAPWAGLEWSGLVVGRYDEAGYSVIDDILPWGNTYVGVGTFSLKAGGFLPAFFGSPDGTHWTIRVAGPAATKGYEGDVDIEAPHHLVAVPDGSLLAFGNSYRGSVPKLWRSTDGVTWHAVTSPSWQSAWTRGGPRSFVTVAAGPKRIVAVGGQGPACCGTSLGSPVLATSTDGVTWIDTILPGDYISDVTAYSGGFAVVGRVEGHPAAWISSDGMVWTAAQMADGQGGGGALVHVFAGENGLFATGTQKDPSTLMSAWASVDGLTWRLLGEFGKNLPDASVWAADGTRIIMFGVESCTTRALVAWSSSDGATWTRLAFTSSATLPQIPPPLPGIAAPICPPTEGTNSGGMAMYRAVVAPEGVVVMGSGDLPQGFWFAAAIK